MVGNEKDKEKMKTIRGLVALIIAEGGGGDASYLIEKIKRKRKRKRWV